MKNNLFLDIHAIQTLPPSNINRDDTGSPKTAQYGGVQRARVSSQAWKKAMRDYFKANGQLENVGQRTLEIVAYVADKLQTLDSNLERDKAMKLAEKCFKDLKVSLKDQRAEALFFISEQQAEKLATAIHNGVTDKKELKQILKDNPSIDIALFGRMVAGNHSLNEDASSQVAHAISTHAVATEFDFYTAVDDLKGEGSSGAGMLGTVEFNSSTLYRYANVAVHELDQQLNNKVAVVNTLKLFIKAFVNSLPTGKVNTFANQTIPHSILISLRKDRPLSLVSAFEKPINSTNGYVEQSLKALINELKRSEKILPSASLNLLLDLDDCHLKEDQFEETENLEEMLVQVADFVTNYLDEAGE
ncbi:type I-E CRISPR-associated protein Cas7/Cse4/CasC [Atopobacter sp. AH10]|uniref:type I-E CRISPR-associated protein Cas7/Cse4/CasC n=1 Tax=Atopobacter sp. AH10 TaxID=2315861 RepID=UPI000EF20EDA|nr:type I-E CRISPR-associated protein Cas7/Cse4/CasC [Atopobacter sp. AH10]RLK64292.1 type I-E CRISPR-associated protein Cas7/Cse4/CasC [Atopobacter sp. AH10]